MRKSLLGISVLVAAGYLLLSVASMVCAVDFGDGHAGGHHHGGKLSHSSSCAWACQANPASVFISTALLLEPIAEVVSSHWTQEVFTPFLSNHFSVSRGPPPALLLS
ncbi:MAG TPA: hypothetical protein VJ805_11675 [Nitrospiraceae bacterium]|nr:hypothetical protein [Nitrospiraceae bacterium]